MKLRPVPYTVESEVVSDDGYGKTYVVIGSLKLFESVRDL